MRLSSLLFWSLITTQIVTAQSSEGTLLIVVTSDAKVFVDGEGKGDVQANKPLKISVKIGEHFVNAQGTLNGSPAEANEIVTVEADKQKVLKLDLSASTNKQTTPPSVSALGPITVANLNFTIPGSLTSALWLSDHPNQEYPDNPNYYYAFEKGDEIVIDCGMTNAKGTNILVLSTYPGKSVKYSNQAFADLKDIHIKVEERSIYRFSLATNHALARNGKMYIRRIPFSEKTTAFNTTVTKKKIYTVKTIQSPQEFFVNSSSNENFKGGKSRVTFSVNFPKNTIEWYYTFSATRDNAQVAQIKQNLKLTSDLTKLIVGGMSGGVLSVGINQLTQPPGSDYCDIYLLDKNNLSSFEAKMDYRHISQGTRENFKSGVVQLKCCMDGIHYIGIKNPDMSYGINVVIEVAAITVDEDWVMEQQ